ncbi:MAG: zinc ribbon domain-containing protein [Gemmatimonadales bacterium]
MSAGSKPYCPECGKPATGNFCQHCGAKLGGRFCNQCGAKAAPAAAFCNQCGSKIDGGGAGRRAAAAAVVGGQNLPWWIAGVTMFVLIVVLGVRMVQPGPPAAPAATGGLGSPLGGAAPDISGMSPREQADRLFNRVMGAAERGDSVEARAFIPMAIAAHEQARPLDNDGLYHLAVLNETAGNLDDAIAIAQEILAAEPDHVLALGVAAQASMELGKSADAEAYYRHLVEAYPQQQQRPLPEYQGHATSMELARSAAEAFLAAR